MFSIMRRREEQRSLSVPTVKLESLASLYFAFEDGEGNGVQHLATGFELDFEFEVF